jgi:hypothetical protein
MKLNIFIASLIFAIILWGSISLSDEYYAVIQVSPKLFNFPKGYTSGSELPDKISIRVKGKGWRLVSVNLGSDTEYLISVGGDSGKQLIDVSGNLNNNRWIKSDLEVIDVLPDTLSILVEKIVTKKIPVLANLNIEYKQGYGLALPITLNTDSVLVSGPRSMVKKMNSIKTEEVKLSAIDSKMLVDLKMPQKSGFSYNIEKIEANLDVQKIVEKQFDEITVEVLDVPQDREVVLLPNKISCSIRGGIQVLGKMSNSQFKSFVFYRDVVRDTIGSVSPNIEIPENTTLLYIKPERLRYIIKTF